MELPKSEETIVSGCARRRDSGHRLNELQRRAQAAAISTDSRDGHETLMLLLQQPRILCASTAHYPHLPAPGACAAHHCQGPMIQGQLPHENTWHTTGCCNVTPASVAIGSPRIPYPSLPPAWVSQSPLITCSFNPLLSGWRRVARGQPTCKGRAKSKAEPQELCKQRREKEISPSSLRSSGLNLHNQLDVPASVEYLNRQPITPKLRQWTLGATVDFRFAFYI